MTFFRVPSADGVSLAVFESGARTSPTVVAVHGYPDNHTVWDGVAEALSDRFRVVTYDVRGAGDSDQPAVRSAYRMEHLVDDLYAVLDAVSPDEPVHLLAHDWGSIQSWPALTDARAAGRIASFTSISGPSLDYSGAWFRGLRRHAGASLRQLAHSYYIGVFQLPGLPEALVRHGVLDRLLAAESSGGPTPVRSEADKVNGLSLYRANVAARLARPRPLPVDVPVQVIAPTADAFVTPALALGAPTPWVRDLRTESVDGGHWIVSQQPDVVAGLVTRFVDTIDARPSTSPSRREHRT